MRIWNRNARLVALTLLVVAGRGRADCLDGHVENFGFEVFIWAHRDFGVAPLPYCDERPVMLSNSGGAECPNLCLGDDEYVPCPGPETTYSVSTSPTGYTITVSAAVNPSLGVLQSAGLSNAYISFQRVGGEVACTYDTVSKTVIEGVETVTTGPGTPFFCWAGGRTVPGAVACTQTVTCTPTVSSGYRFWSSPSGGAYEDATNWASSFSGYCAPVHDTQRSDSAMFQLATANHIPVTAGPLATAGQWIVQNSLIAFSGSGQVFSTSATNPSLVIRTGGQLRLASGASLDSVHASVGASGATNSMLEVKGGRWTNTESAKIGRGILDVLDGGTGSTKSLTIGSGNGAASVRVTGVGSRFDVNDVLYVGDTTAGTVELDKGSLIVTPVTVTPRIGKSAPGTVTVRGDDSHVDSSGYFQVADYSLIVGDGASGRLNIMRGGQANINPDLVVGGYGAGAGGGEVVVDGQGGGAALDVHRGTFVNATELQEVLVQNGGEFSTKELFIGNSQIRPGTADVTLRGPVGNYPTLTVGLIAGGGGAGTFVGEVVPGQLNLQSAARAELYNGLHVGEGAQGIVMVSGLNNPPGPATGLTVNGETQVGIGAPGIVQLDHDAFLETHGDLKIGLGGDNPSGSVNLNSGSHLWIHGTLAVGASGIGLLNIVDEPGMFPSHVTCDTLLVGGNTFGATGIIVASFVPNVSVNPGFSHLTVYGNAQVGMGAGRGEILLADPSGRLEINGTMTIGSPGGGPGGGAVALVDALIDGTGNIVVNKNGSLTGTGTVAVPHVSAGGYISPGLSPGTLTIDGDLDILPGGVVVIEYAGLNPGEFDVLHVTGQTTLGGRLEIHFRDGFSPDDPVAFVQSQDFVEADGVIMGDYDQRIYAFPDIFADFDDDGDKDFFDVAAFQNCFGLSGAALELACARADWEDNGVLNEIEVRELTARLSGPR